MKTTILSLVLAFVFFACTAPRVHFRSHQDMDERKYKSFNFYDHTATGDTIASTYYDNLRMLKLAIINEMKKRGLGQQQDGDILVNIGVVARDSVSVADSLKFMNPEANVAVANAALPTRMREGTVTVFLIDRKANTLVWQGTIESVIPEDRAKRKEAIDKGMERLFKKIPPPAK